jgi:AraC family transcriptional regulator
MRLWDRSARLPQAPGMSALPPFLVSSVFVILSLAGAGGRGPAAPSGLAPDESHILHATSRTHFWEGAAGLSIKTFFGGRALYDTGRGRFAVDERSYLVLNEGQRYAITLDSREKVESFCVFFARGLASEVSRAVSARAEDLLDEPEASTGSPAFWERTYAHDALVSPALRELRRRAASGMLDEREALRESLHGLLERLLVAQGMVRREGRTLSSLKASTRVELLHRLYRARDFMAATLEEPLRLDRMARVACLSPTHFLRTFRQLFGQSPHQYLIGLRLAEARRLLLSGGATVTDVGAAVGFESLGSFSRLFKERVGSSPDAFRKMARSEKTRRARRTESGFPQSLPRKTCDPGRSV